MRGSVSVQKEEEQRRVERQQRQQQERLARLSVSSGSAPAPLSEKPTMRKQQPPQHQNGDSSSSHVTVSATITLDAQDVPDAGASDRSSQNFTYVRYLLYAADRKAQMYFQWAIFSCL